MYRFSIDSDRGSMGGIMERIAVLGSKAAVALALVLAVLGQVFVIPFLAADTAAMYPEFAHLQVPGILGCVAIVACAQVFLVCTWRLLTLASRREVFAPTAVRWVDMMIGASFICSALFLGAIGYLSTANALAPGVMLGSLIGSLGTAGIAFLLIVLRGLLTRATACESDLACVI